MISVAGHVQLIDNCSFNSHEIMKLFYMKTSWNLVSLIQIWLLMTTERIKFEMMNWFIFLFVVHDGFSHFLISCFCFRVQSFLFMFTVSFFLSYYLLSVFSLLTVNLCPICLLVCNFLVEMLKWMLEGKMWGWKFCSLSFTDCSGSWLVGIFVCVSDVCVCFYFFLKQGFYWMNLWELS